MALVIHMLTHSDDKGRPDAPRYRLSASGLILPGAEPLGTPWQS